MIWDIFEEETGARLTHSFGRVGGMAKPPTPDFKDMVARRRRRASSRSSTRARSSSSGTASSSIASRASAMISAEDALALGWTGAVPALDRRALRRAQGAPVPASTTAFDFDVPVGTTGDNYDRFMVPPGGDPPERAHHRAGARADARRRARSTSTTRASSCPPKDEVYTTIEGTIQHFKIVMEGIKVPAGEVLLVHRRRQRRARLLPRLRRQRHAVPRAHPPAVLRDRLQGLEQLITGRMIADVVPDASARST